MNSLTQVLHNLCEGKDMGALVITKDGMMIDSFLAEDFDGETLGAFMSQIALNIKAPLQTLGHDEFTRYILESNQGKVYLVDLGKALLIVLAGDNIKQDDLNVALFQAASSIKKTGRIDV